MISFLPSMYQQEAALGAVKGLCKWQTTTPPPTHTQGITAIHTHCRIHKHTHTILHLSREMNGPIAQQLVLPGSLLADFQKARAKEGWGPLCGGRG